MNRVPFTTTWIEEGRILAGSIPQLAEDIDVLKAHNIGAVISLTRRHPRTYPGVESRWFNWAQYPIPDNGIASDEVMLDAVSYVEHCYRRGEPIYIHCRGGIGRTGTILIAYYVLRRGFTLDEARDKVRVRRNYEGNASAADQGSPQREWIDALPQRLATP